MSKAVLVMDMPSSCEECPLLSVGRYCKGKEAPNVAVDSHLDKSKPDWCPLKPMPEKKDSMNLNSIMEKCKDRDSIMDSVLKQFIVDGYNACIDELLKGEEG